MGEENRFGILIVRSHCLGGARGDVFEGTVLKVPDDLPIAEARAKVAAGYAVKLPDDKPAVVEIAEQENPAAGAVETRDPALEERDPAVMPASQRPPTPKPRPSGKGAKKRRRK